MIKRIIYLDQQTMAAMQNTDKAVTIITRTHVLDYNSAENDPRQIGIELPLNFELIEAKFFEREGQEEVLLAVIAEKRQYYLIIIDENNGRIIYSSPLLEEQPSCYIYFKSKIYYSIDKDIFSWEVNELPKLFYSSETEVKQFIFANIAFHDELIISDEEAVFTVDMISQKRSLHFLLEEKPKMLVFNSFLNELFITAEKDVFYIYDLTLDYSNKVAPPEVNYSYSGCYNCCQIIPRDVGYLIASDNGRFCSVEVVYEAPRVELTEQMRRIMNFECFTLRIRAEEELFNAKIAFCGISKISADFFFACTTNCCICAKASEMEQCYEDHASLGNSESSNQLISKLRLNLMTQSEDYLNEFIDNIEQYELGETKDLLDRRFDELINDFYYLIKCYAFTENYEFLEKIDTKWRRPSDKEEIEQPIVDEDEVRTALNPYYKEEGFRVMKDSQNAENDLELFKKLFHAEQSSEPIEDVKKYGLSDYVIAYFPHVAPAIWKMSQNYRLAQRKFSEFNEQMGSRSQFLKEEVLVLFSSEDELAEREAESKRLINAHLLNYHQHDMELIEQLEDDENAVRVIYKVATPMHISNKLAYDYYRELLSDAALKHIKELIMFFKLNATQGLVAEGKNPVSEVITEQLSFKNEHYRYYKMLEKFEIGKNDKELFAILPNSVNQIVSRVNNFTDEQRKSYLNIEECLEMQRPIVDSGTQFNTVIEYHELYNMLEVNSCTELMFFVTHALKNNVEQTYSAIELANEENKGTFEFLTLYDVREYKPDIHFNRVVFHCKPNVFRLSDVLLHETRDLMWLNNSRKSWLENQQIEGLLEKYPIGMKEIKVIIRNLGKALGYIYKQDALATSYTSKDSRALTYLDTTNIFLDIETLEVTIPYLFEPQKEHDYQLTKMVNNVLYIAPEAIFGAFSPSSDVYSLMMVFLNLYHAFIYVPKEKEAKRKDIRPFSLFVGNIEDILSLSEQISLENVEIYQKERIKNPPNEESFVPDIKALLITSILRSQASLCFDIQNIPQEEFCSDMISSLITISEESLAAAEYFLNTAIFQPFADQDAEQEKFVHPLYETNKERLLNLTEHMNKYDQEIMKKCLVFDPVKRMSVEQFLAEWKCDEIDRPEHCRAESEKPAEKPVSFAKELHFTYKFDESSGDDLSESEIVEKEEFDLLSFIERQKEENSEKAEEVVEEEEISEHTRRREQERIAKEEEIQAFKEMYEQQFGVLPDDMDLEKLAEENQVDFELPEDEKVDINLTEKIDDKEERNFFEQVIENPEKFVEEEKEPEIEKQEEKVLIESVVNELEDHKVNYKPENEDGEEIEEYQIPEDFEMEGKESVSISEEKNWFEIAAQEEQNAKQQEQQQKIEKQRKKVEAEEESDEYEEEEEEEEEVEVEKESSRVSGDFDVNKHVDSKSDKPIWAIDSEGENSDAGGAAKAAVKNGEDEESEEEEGEEQQVTYDDTLEQAANDHEIMFDEEGKAFWFDEDGEMHYVE